MGNDWFSDPHWERCDGKNSKRGKCLAPPIRHLTHKKHWLTGAWYGQLPSKPVPKLQRPKKKGWF